MAPIVTTRRGGMRSAIVIVVGITTILLASAMAEAAPAPPAEVSCGDAVSALIPCGSFLLGGGDAAAGPSESCCRGARALRGMAATVGARRALCRCLEQSGPSFGVLPDRARQLPARCRLGVDILVSPNTDCDKIP